MACLGGLFMTRLTNTKRATDPYDRAHQMCLPAYMRVLWKKTVDEPSINHHHNYRNHNRPKISLEKSIAYKKSRQSIHQPTRTYVIEIPPAKNPDEQIGKKIPLQKNPRSDGWIHIIQRNP